MGKFIVFQLRKGKKKSFACTDVTGGPREAQRKMRDSFDAMVVGAHEGATACGEDGPKCFKQGRLWET
jgi:hypothetical protein